MIRNVGKLLLALCVVTVGGGIVANAQIGSDAVIRGNIPFAFMVGNTELPAGEYDVKALDDNARNVLEVRSVKDHKSVFADSENVETKGQRIEKRSELVFDKVGDKYFLTQIWVEGSAFGSELPKSRMETSLEVGGVQSERHSIVAMLRHLKHHQRSA